MDICRAFEMNQIVHKNIVYENGNKITLNEFFSLNKREINWIIYRQQLNSDKYIASDIFNDLYIELSHRIKKDNKFKNEDHIYNWLGKICRNLLINEYRKHGLETEEIINDIIPEEINDTIKTKKFNKIIEIINNWRESKTKSIMLDYANGISILILSDKYTQSDKQIGYLIKYGIEKVKVSLGVALKPKNRTSWLKSARKSIIQRSKGGDLIAQYKSMSDASKKTGIDRKSIRDNCMDLPGGCGKYIWQYE